MPTSAPIPWPAYFVPRAGIASDAAVPSLRIPTHILDTFYVPTPNGRTRESITILGCLQGDLDVIAGVAPASLSDELQAQIQLLDVGRRRRYRAINTDDLFIATLAALEQPVANPALNAPIHLYVAIQAHLSITNDQLQVTPLDIEGCMTVGRIDVLAAYASGVAHALPSPIAPEEHTYHLLVPVAPAERVVKGHGIALIYPLLDPAILDSADNTHIMLRIIYEVLARLQQDVLRIAPQHHFAMLALPVPSRRRLEADLQADGYQIHGDVAVKSADIPPSISHIPTFLDRLRRIARQWVAPQIELPPQATPQHYQAIITDLLESLAQPADQELLRAMTAIVDAGVGPTYNMTIPEAPQSVQHRAALPQPNRLPRVPSSSGQPPRRDWSSDFTDVTRLPVRRSRHGAWWKDAARGTPIEPNDMTAAAEWTADFLAERPTTQPPPIAASDQSEPQQPDWSKDFEPVTPTDAPTRDWAKDFE